MATLAIRRLRRRYQPQLGASPAVVFLGGCYAVLTIEELLAAVGVSPRDSLVPAPRRKPPG